MGRIARVVIPGYPHHVTQRGNRRAAVFTSDANRAAYLRFIEKYTKRHEVAVWAYCLMTNHVHFVMTPVYEASLGLALRDAHTVYAMYFNTYMDMDGHVWQGRFHSCPMDEPHLWPAVRYIARNPVRAGIVERAEKFPWSSAAGHCGLRNDTLLSPDSPPPDTITDWRHGLSHEEDEHALQQIRKNTRTGRPCGSSLFLNHLEAMLRCSVRPQKRGRKIKKEPRYRVWRNERNS